MGRFDNFMARIGLHTESALQAKIGQAIHTAIDDDRKMRGRIVRSFEAAKLGRLQSGWSTTQLSLNHSLYRDLTKVRARSRQMSKDNDYVKHFFRMVMANVVGNQGASVKVHALNDDGTIDELDSKFLMKEFAEWSRPGNCDVTGKLSRAALERLTIQVVARDGEAIIEEIAAGPWKYQLRMHDVALLDENYNVDLANNAKIRMGVEMDGIGRPVAYHMFAAEAADIISGSYRGAKHVRVNADRIIHAHLAEDVNQIRGVPWLHTIMNRTQQLHGFEEAAVVAARMGASKMGFFTSPDGSLDPLADATEDGPDGVGTGELIQEAEPGHFGHLPPGYDFKEWSPDYPHQHYAAFVKACLRGIAAGAGVSYTSLANDLEGVNYSSIRAGLLEERETWKALQDWMIGVVQTRIYSNWLKNALAGRLSKLPAYKYDKFNSAIWQGRRWSWVDPKNDIESSVIAINEGLTSRSRVIREQGADPDEIWRELELENQRLAGVLRPDRFTGNQTAQPGATTP